MLWLPTSDTLLVKACQGHKVNSDEENIKKNSVGFSPGQYHPCYVDECLPSAQPGAIAPIKIDDMQWVNKNIH